MKLKPLVASLITIYCLSVSASAQTVSDYLTLTDIGSYRISRPEKLIPGFQPTGGPRSYASAGVVSESNHFIDHADTTYEVMYLGGGAIASPTVVVTQHLGADSDQWLMHEIDESFRDAYGIPNNSYGPRQINGQTVYVLSIGGREYRWLSGSKIIEVSYHGSLRTLPEPLEVVQVYLAKHPSTLPAITLAELRSKANKTTWIKDEMSRRLWLCDKWAAQIQPSDPKLYDKVKSIYDSMKVFLDYREKYFGMSATTEKTTIIGYLNQKNDAGLKTKLAEYKAWWAAHKNDAISIP